MRLRNHAFVARLLALSIVAAGVLAGCGSGVIPNDGNSFAGAGFAGAAMAGKLPLGGASVQLYAAGSSGKGSSTSALLTSSLTTGVNGAFTVPGGYSCPSATSQLYVVALGGKPGPGAASANGAIALVTALGACNQIVGSSQIVVNEVTTVAAAYALAQFFSAGANIEASSTNSTGLQNAFAMADALAGIVTGSSPGPGFAANGTSPALRIDSLANLLNSCAASTASGSACSALFSATTPPSGAPAPTNILDAALNLVRHPAANVASIYTLSTSSTAFAPALAAAPADWTLFINYTGGGMSAPSGLGIDGAGDVWVASYFNAASLFSPLGKPLLGVTGYGLNASYGLAVDANNDAWIPNEPGLTVPSNSVTVLNSGGQSIAGSGGFTSGGLNFPIAVAIDTDDSAWVVDYGNSRLTHLSSSGQPLSGSAGYSSAQLIFPVAVAIDGSHNVWVANQSSTTVTKVAQDGSLFTSYSCGNGPSGLAIDQLGNVWVANYYGNSISEVSTSGAVLANGPYTGGGIDHPQGIAIDGAGNVWIANYRGPSLTELAGAASAAPGALLSPPGGLGPDAALLEAYAIAVDASGNLWISNFGSNTLTEFIGLAAPVRTPLLGLPAAP
jgi:sugar lactone lactonase YvrE